jgi:hypothetical protein
MDINMLDSCGMDCINYSATLIGWDLSGVMPSGLYLSALSLKYGLNAQAARSNLINSKNLIIIGDTLLGINCEPTSISDINKEIKSLYLYPNPAKDKLYLAVDKNNYSYQTKIEIYNTLGQLLLTKDVNQNSRTELDISNFAKGLYYLRYEQSVIKVIVE